MRFLTFTYSNGLRAAWVGDAVDDHSGVAALLGGSCCFCSSWEWDLRNTQTGNQCLQNVDVQSFALSVSLIG